MKPWLYLALAGTLCSLGMPSGRCEELPHIVSPNEHPGLSGGGGSFTPEFSGDGRFIVFVSHANNLVTNDDLGLYLDVFVRELAGGITRLASVSTNGFGGANGNANYPSISSNGHWGAFASAASNLVPGDANDASDVFVRNLVASTTTLVSVNLVGRSPTSQIYPNRLSCNPRISADGRWIAFESYAKDLVTNCCWTGPLAGAFINNIYVRDLASNQTVLVSVDTAGTFGGNTNSALADISPDGRFILFTSQATNLVPHATSPLGEVYVRDVLAGTTYCLSSNAAAFFSPSQAYVAFNPTMSSDGRTVAFYAASSADAVLALLFRCDLFVGSCNLVDLVGLPEGQASLSADGMRITYSSDFNIYVWDSVTGSNELVNVSLNGIDPGNAPADSSVLSPDGNRVLFFSAATDLAVPATNGLSQLFMRDLVAKTTRLITVTTNGEASREPVQFTLPVFSPDGQSVAFESQAADLVADDRNSASDVFVHNLETEETVLISRRHGALPQATALLASRIDLNSISTDGRYVAFTSRDAFSFANNTNRQYKAFRRDLLTGAVTPISVDSSGGFAPNLRAVSPALSSNGQYTAYFLRDVTNLNSYSSAIWWVDLPNSVTLRVDLGDPFPQGSSGGLAISPDGRVVALHDSAGKQIYIRDMATGTNQLISKREQGDYGANSGSIVVGFSPDGRWLLFASKATDLATNHTAGTTNLFARDLVEGRTIMVSSTNGPGDPANYTQLYGGEATFSGNSRFVVYTRTTAFNGATRSIYVRDLLTLSNTLVHGESGRGSPSISADGRYVAFTMLTPSSGFSVTNVGVKDLCTGIVRPLFARTAPLYNFYVNEMISPLLSGDGRFVVFSAQVADLVPDDRNNTKDIFVHDRLLNSTLLVSRSRFGGSGNYLSSNPVMAADGRTVVFQSVASDLVPGDYNDTRDVFVVNLGGIDSDGDQLDDDWELACFNTLSRDGTGDFDGDGLTDAQEFRAGTDPTSQGSSLHVLKLTSTGSSATTVLWSAVSGRTYRVQFKNAVSDTTWSDLPGDVTATSSTGSKTDTSAGAQSQRFYRVVLVTGQ